MSEDIELIYNGEDRPSKACFEPITNTKYSKPDGGLWTSPLNKSNGKSAWQSWCEERIFILSATKRNGILFLIKMQKP